MVTVVRSAMIRNANKKTLLKVTMSMMTTMRTVVHRALEKDCSSSPFSDVKVACIQGVVWSSRCCCLLLDWDARPCVGLCSNAFLPVLPA